MELASVYPPVELNFEVAPTFLENGWGGGGGRRGGGHGGGGGGGGHRDLSVAVCTATSH
jgi:hypothetical protein